jgi:hypothetical protein
MILVSLMLIVTLLFAAAPVSASDGNPPSDQDTPQQSDSLWSFFSSFSLSDLLESIFSLIDNRDQSLDEMMVDSSFTDAEKEEIAKYSNGKTPAEMTAQFCQDSASSDAQSMINDIRNSYAGTEADPKSPVHLMDIFDKMSGFCK